MKTREFIYLGVITAICALSACGPASKLRRAEKLIKKAELQGAVWQVDTVYKEIPVFLTETHLDSIFVVKQGDTVFITKDRLSVKITRLKGDTVFVDAKCEADTVFREVPVTVTKTIEAKSWLKWWHLLIAIVAGWIIGRLFKLVL